MHSWINGEWLNNKMDPSVMENELGCVTIKSITVKTKAMFLNDIIQRRVFIYYNERLQISTI